MHVILNGRPLEEVDYFKYLGSQVAAEGGCERDMVHRIKKCLHGVIVRTSLYGAEAWGMRSAERW